MLTRRDALRRIGGFASFAATGSPGRLSLVQSPQPLLLRQIPKSGERLPAIGLGTARRFNVAAGDTAHLAAAQEVLRVFSSEGATAIDVAPHGTVEATLGDGLRAIGAQDRVFVAAKVIVRESSPRSASQGRTQLAASHRLLRRDRFDLLQVGNLFDVDAQLPTVLEWRDRGLARYAGITVSTSAQYADLERLARSHRLEFIQLNYSMERREAEARLLPFAADQGIAVLVNTPFEAGRLFGDVAGKPLPSWAADLGIASWAQFFLKYLLSHASVTAVVPATANPAHMLENIGAARGHLPTAAERARMASYFDNL